MVDKRCAEFQRRGKCAHTRPVTHQIRMCQPLRQLFYIRALRAHHPFRLVGVDLSRKCKVILSARAAQLRRLNRKNNTANTRKITIVPGHKNHPRSLLYPPTTTQLDEKKRATKIMAICFMLAFVFSLSWCPLIPPKEFNAQVSALRASVYGLREGVYPIKPFRCLYRPQP